MNAYLVTTLTDSGPAEDGLADAPPDGGGQLLAAGPVHGAGGLASRPAPAGVVIARFSAQEAARSWFDAVAGKLDRTTLLAACATTPGWWPPKNEPERRQWSRRRELPAGRVRPIRKIQTSSGPRRPPAPSPPAHPAVTGLARRRRCTRPQSGSVS